MTFVLDDDALPPWSASQETGASPDYGCLPALASRFVSLAPAARAAEVARYAQQHCFPRFDLPRASGLYLLLRLVFDLPLALPRDEAQVFGGWIHPSIGTPDEPFALSWPLVPLASGRRFAVQPFEGYFGKGYDAEAEHAYFDSRFPLRDGATLERCEVVPAG